MNKLFSAPSLICTTRNWHPQRPVQ